MKISNEVKVGVLGLSAIFLLIWGYNFLKGNNILTSDIVVTADFNNIDGLDVGAPITIKGFRVGSVTDIYIKKENPGVVVVELNIDKGTRIPSNAVAALVQPSLMSGKTITMEFEGGCEDGSCLKSGDKIKGRVGSMLDMAKEAFDPYINKMDSIAGVFIEIAKQEEGGLKQSVHEVQGTITNLKKISELLALLLEGSRGNIESSMDHMTAIAGNIRKNNDQITALMANVTQITEQLKNAEINQTIASTNETVKKFGEVATEVKTTLAETQKLMGQLNALTDFSNQEGLLAALIHDKKLLSDVKKTIDEVNLLTTDIREHPERYRTVLSNKYKPYGGKNYKPKN